MDAARCFKTPGTMLSRDKVVCFLLSCSYHHLICSPQATGMCRGINSNRYNKSVALNSKAHLRVPLVPYQPAYLFLPTVVLSFPSVDMRGHVTTSSGTMLRFSLLFLHIIIICFVSSTIPFHPSFGCNGMIASCLSPSLVRDHIFSKPLSFDYGVEYNGP
ncbi:hypothetical protein NA56DRAFT_699425 [Hyaloscypha hepaticicola]|uniref:Uncharacterized protein n=1 Tax=Hyaloscypha hepaticicola TaxID=2082293 RepID=A0A2J6QGU4_9HELO|nr:hypothetical protein NA56DRAFT_699425 [Hyaloscypha hepaticicola]